MNFRKAMTAMAIAAAMAGSPALAADGSLAPGKPAGVHEAQRHPKQLQRGLQCHQLPDGERYPFDFYLRSAAGHAHLPQQPQARGWAEMHQIDIVRR
jgi:hypothetical protein